MLELQPNFHLLLLKILNVGKFYVLNLKICLPCIYFYIKFIIINYLLYIIILCFKMSINN